MSAAIIELRPRQGLRAVAGAAQPLRAEAKPARLASARAVLSVMDATFPLLELAYHALQRGDIVTARAALEELSQEPIPEETPNAAVEWRDAQVNLLAVAVVKFATLAEATA